MAHPAYYPDRLHDQIIIVTGGNKGIGRGIAERLALDGAHVVITGRDEAAGDETVRFIRDELDAGGSCTFVRADNAAAADIRSVVGRTLETHGRIDGLVNNAATMHRETILTTEPEFLERVLRINLGGAVEYCRQVLNPMMKRGKGRIVNIGSTHAWSGLAELFPYSLSKGALLTLTHHLARNYGSSGIRANWVTVGWVKTPGEIEVWARQGKDEAWIDEKGHDVVPFGRLQTSEEIGAAVAFLFSPDADQITDTELDVTGGLRV